MKKYKLSSEEEEILEAFHSNALSSSITFAEDKKIAEVAASNFADKSERINIRLKY